MVNNELNKYLNKLSVVVLSFNREFSLRAIINYWCRYPVEMIIMDGSYKKINFPKINQHNPNFKLRYYHEPKSYSERIKKATYIINREYILFSADDEIHLPRGIAKSIKFLESNAEFNSSMGQCNIIFKIRNNLKIRKVYKKLEDVNSTQIYKNMEERVFHYFNNYVCATLYSVMRSQVWKRNVRHTFSISISCPYAFERLFEFTNIALGKCHVHDTVSWIRNGINPPIYDAPGFKKKKYKRSYKLGMWMKMKSKTLKKEHAEIKNLIEFYGVKKENVSFIFSQIFQETKKQSLIIQIKQFLMYKKFSRIIILKTRLLTNFILRNFLKRDKLKKIDDYFCLNKNEINNINKFIFEEQGLNK